MRKVNLVKVLALFLLSLFIVSAVVSYVFGVDFVEKHIDSDEHIGEPVRIRVSIFQTQMFYLSIFFGITGSLTLLFSKQLTKFAHKRKKIILNIIFLIFILLLLFAIGELVLRVFFSEQIYSEYGHGPGGVRFVKNVKYNSLRFRDIEHNIEKDTEVFRIIIVGDSFTFGSGIENLEDIYPRILQKKLNEEHGENKFEVITLANRGHSTQDEVKTLEEVGLNFSPDLIVLGYYINDAEGQNSRKGFERMFFHHYTIPYEIGGLLYPRSLMYYFLESRLKNIERNLGIGKSYEEYAKHLYSESNPSFEEHQHHLAKFINLSKEKGAPVILMNIPAISNTEDYPFMFVSNYVRELAESNGALYLDILSEFSGYEPKDLRVSFMDSHMNELGHNITANALFNLIEEQNLLSIEI